MDVRGIVSAAIMFVFLSSLACAQLQPAKQNDPSRRPNSYKRSETFLEYTLKQINPSDKDYGSRWEWWRTVVVERTVKDGYFWSNLTALGLLCCLFLIIVCQRNNQHKRDWAAADVLAQYEHALARANAQILDLTSKNHEFASVMADARETAAKALTSSSFGSNNLVAGTEKDSSVKPRIEPSKTAISKDQRRHQSHIQPTETGKQIALFTPEVDLMMTVNSLKQQLAHSEQRNSVLQRRIVSTGRDRVPREKQSGPKSAGDKSATA